MRRDALSKYAQEKEHEQKKGHEEFVISVAG